MTSTLSPKPYTSEPRVQPVAPFPAPSSKSSGSEVVSPADSVFSQQDSSSDEYRSAHEQTPSPVRTIDHMTTPHQGELACDETARRG